MSPDASGMSPECTLAHRPGYKDLHRECRQTADVPLPHGDLTATPRIPTHVATDSVKRMNCRLPAAR